MATTSDSQLYADFSRANYGGLDLVFVGGGDDDQGFWCGRCLESFVSDIGLKNICE